MARDYRWVNLGAFNADGMHGGEALARGLERMVTGIESPVTSERGLAARLRYLTASAAGYEAMERAGIDVLRSTLFAWLAEDQTPRPANLRRIDSAYWELRRRRVVADLKRRLNRDGRGTRIEINPVDQRAVEKRFKRDLSTRSINVRGNVWDRVVDAWQARDMDELEEIWDEIIAGGIGTDWDGYTHVSSVGWSA